MSLVDSIISTIAKWEGCTEGGATHKEIIELYNKGKAKSEYTMTLDDPWCAACIGAAATACGMTDIIPVSASCDRMISWFKNNGRFYTPAEHTPKRGDIIFYDWDSNHTSDHVGIVDKCDPDRMTVIEGNMCDSVGWRILFPSYEMILGYGVPDYENASTKETDTETEIVNTNAPFVSYLEYFDSVNKRRIRQLPSLYNGCDGIYVTFLQLALIVRLTVELDVDGDFGPLTETAVKVWQGVAGLEIDGICGPETWSSLLA